MVLQGPSASALKLCLVLSGVPEAVSQVPRDRLQIA